MADTFDVAPKRGQAYKTTDFRNTLGKLFKDGYIPGELNSFGIDNTIGGLNFKVKTGRAIVGGIFVELSALSDSKSIPASSTRQVYLSLTINGALRVTGAQIEILNGTLPSTPYIQLASLTSDASDITTVTTSMIPKIRMKSVTVSQTGELCAELSSADGDYTKPNYYDFGSDPWTSKNDAAKFSISGGVCTITVTEDSTDDRAHLALLHPNAHLIRINFSYKLSAQGSQWVVFGVTPDTGSSLNNTQLFAGFRHKTTATNTIDSVNGNINPQTDAGQDSKSFSASNGTTYYVTMIIDKMGQTITTTIYSDAARTTVLVTTTGTSSANFTGSLAFVYKNRVTTNAGTTTLVIDDLSIYSFHCYPNTWSAELYAAAANMSACNGLLKYNCRDRIYQPVSISANWTVDYEFRMDGNYGGYNGGSPYWPDFNVLIGSANPQKVGGGGYGVYYGINPQNPACGGGYKFYLSIAVIDNGTINISSNGATQLSPDTTYYMRAKKTAGDTYVLECYSDSGRTTLIESKSYTAPSSKTYDLFNHIQIGGSVNGYREGNHRVGNLSSTQVQYGGSNLNETFSTTVMKKYFMQFDASKKVASLLLVLNKADTGNSQIALSMRRLVSHPNYLSSLTAVRLISLSDFSTGVKRYILCNLVQDPDIIETDTPVLDLFGYRHYPTLGFDHFHAQIPGSEVVYGVDV